MEKSQAKFYDSYQSDENDFTVIVCCRNSSKTIKSCVEAIIKAGGYKDLIVIDGKSSDETRKIVEQLGVKVIEGHGSGLSKDRQLGIDLVKTSYAFFVDSDHIIGKHFFREMLKDFRDFKVDFLQSRLRLLEPRGILAKGEDSYYRNFHNTHWNKKMIGVAPSLFMANELKSGARWQLFSERSAIIDDTSWAKRASDRGALFHVGGPEVYQIHSARFIDYLRKFVWYGKGDADFILEFPRRRNSMFFHLLIRYPVIFGSKMLRKGDVFGLIFVQTQGLTRFISASIRVLTLKLQSKFSESQ